MSAPFLISKALDPVFAVFIGVSAAAMRINREEKERGKSTEQTIESVRRRWGLLVGGGKKDDGVS
ncbi:hypothetical protein LTR66_007242 [Elasticomyces elasticus]|nr:hypothetical protein LTR50_006333 [Elasticomyces elasticus]KAK4988717.1 hypothetical protein LTR66_007242 [Elasticomyces elasticus]